MMLWRRWWNLRSWRAVPGGPQDRPGGDAHRAEPLAVGPAD